MEEAQKKKKQQAIRMALTEILMAVSVICLTVFLTMLVLGYNIGSGWKIERSGLVQIDSLPSGAKVTIDGEEEILLRTNLSKSYPSGQHLVVLSKDGYNTWRKEISVTEGYYYRLVYPRLFLKDIKKEKILDFDGLKYLAGSSSGDMILVKNDETGQLEVIRMNGAKAIDEALDGSEAFLAEKEIEIKEWSKIGNKVLAKIIGETVSWMVIDLDNIEESVNLTEMFEVEFSEIKFENESASKLLAIVDGGLKEISLGEAEMSKTLVSNIGKFANNGEDIVYVTLPDENGKRIVGVYKEGEKAGTKIKKIKNAEAMVNVVVDKYYEDDFLAITIDSEMLVYQGKVPSYEEGAKGMELIIEKELGFVPASLETKGKKELIVARNGKNIAVMDAEMFAVVEYEMIDENADWLDEFMLYGVKDGKVVVWDFDGLNERSLVEGAQGGTMVKLSKNGKWLYYINEKGVLTGAKVS